MRVWRRISFHTTFICAPEWNPIQTARGCPIVHFSFILMQTLLLCMCSFLGAKASFLNTTSQATTKESSTSNTSVGRSPTKQDKKGCRPTHQNQNCINQILSRKGRKLLKPEICGKAIKKFKESVSIHLFERVSLQITCCQKQAGWM